MENNNVMIPFRVFFAFKIHFGINPFAPEPPVTARADPPPFYPL